MAREGNRLTAPNFGKGGNSFLNPDLPKSVNLKIIDIEQKRIDSQEKKSERGFLGRFFGSGDHSPKNIAGLLIVITLLSALIYTGYMLFHDPCGINSNVLDFWEIITPLITLSLGYLFGKSS